MTLKDRLIAVRDLIDGVQVLAGTTSAARLHVSPATGTVEVPADLLDRVSDTLSDAISDIETRRSMIDQTVAALRGTDVRVRPAEMRAISDVSADLRNGLTAMPDDTPGRESVVRAARTLYDTLDAIVGRDRSWT